MDDIIKRIIKFRDDRDWGKYHNPKDLSISICLEANELLENFQWRSSEEALLENKEKIKEELADVLIYALTLSNDLGFDVRNIIEEKLERNATKYSVEKSYGSNKKYTDF